MRQLAAAGLIWLTGLLATTAQAGEDTVFTDFAGQPQQLESYVGNGKWLLVMFWAHDCHICNQEAESYAQFHAEHAERDAQVLGISIDGQQHKAKAEAFIERHDLPFPNLIGEPTATMLYFTGLTRESFRGTPTFLLYDPAGTLKAAQAGAVPIASVEAYIARHKAQADS